MVRDAWGGSREPFSSYTLWYAVVWVAPEIDKAYLVATNTGLSNAHQACDSAISAMIVMEDRRPLAE